MKLKIMIMALLMVSVGIGSAVNYLPASTMTGDLDTSTYNLLGDAIVRPATITIMGDGTDIIAVYRNGTVLSKSTNFDTVFDAAIAVLPANGASLTIIGRDDGGQYQINSNHTISSKNWLSLDAKSARFKAAKNITPFHFLDVDYSAVDIGFIDGTSQTGTGIQLTECDVLSVKVVLVQSFDRGIAIVENNTQSSLDCDIYFQYIATCNDGIYIETYDVQGLRVRGNFINYCYNTSIRIRGMDSLALNWNDIEVLALEGAGVTPYGVYITGGGYGNTMKIPGFLGGYTVNKLYDTMGRWFYTLPNTHMSLGTDVSSKSVGVMSHEDKFLIDGSLQVNGIITEVGKLNTVLHVINSQNCATLIPYNCIVTDNMDGTFRITTTGPNANIASPTISVNGGIARYVYIVGSVVGEPIGVGGRNFFYKTGAHGFSPSYYKSTVCFYKNKWETRRFDMHTLSVGGDDWKKNTITGWRYDIAGPTGTVYDISYIALVAEAPGLV